MKLQLALDDISLDEALSLVEKTRAYVDIIEIGTPFIIEDGLEPVRKLKRLFPEIKVLADTKIMDAGDYEARSAFQAGADYVTVLGVTDLLTVESCVRTAREFGKTIVVDMICVRDMEDRIRQLESLGVTALAVHTGVDQQAAGRTPIDDLKLMKAVSKCSEIFVAGGINITTLPEYKALKADVVIVGSAIRHAKDPVQAAREFYRLMKT
jgi:3-hexulose-6-phosphate synthase